MNIKFFFLFTIVAFVCSISVVTAADNKWKDGTYKATFDKADSHGWKAFLEVVIKGNKIVTANYDYVNAKDGSLKTKDANYNAAMKKAKGTSPEEYTKKLDAELISKQSANLDGVTGATTSSKLMKLLAAEVLKKATSGDTKESVLPLPPEN